ncbi:MAG: hypothetical protein KJ749_00200, partial [Planctomycetes bacterium]|nr:hypothetical protein [Planctomycetota bacterium]
TGLCLRGPKTLLTGLPLHLAPSRDRAAATSTRTHNHAITQAPFRTNVINVTNVMGIPRNSLHAIANADFPV